MFNRNSRRQTAQNLNQLTAKKRRPKQPQLAHQYESLEQRLLLNGDQPDRFEPNQDFDEATHLQNCAFDCTVGAIEHAGRVRYDDLTIHPETAINYDQESVLRSRKRIGHRGP